MQLSYRYQKYETFGEKYRVSIEICEQESILRALEDTPRKNWVGGHTCCLKRSAAALVFFEMPQDGSF